jgi:hypothetical protein
MPVNTDKARLIYNAVSQDYDVGDFEIFAAKMNEPSKRRLVYDAVSKKYDVGKTFEDFDSVLWRNDAQNLPTLRGTGFKAGVNQLLSGVAEAESDFFGGLDNLAKYVAEKTGTKSGGLFANLEQQNKQWADYFRNRGINAEAGKLFSTTAKLYGGLGRATFDLPVIAAMGLPAHGALTGAAAAAGEDGNIAASAAQGLVEGALMHGIFKGLGFFKPNVRIPAGGVIFGGQQMQAELQKPPEERDWEAVVAASLTGAGLSALDASRGESIKELKQRVRDAYGSKKVKEAAVQVERGAQVIEQEMALDDVVANIKSIVNKPSSTEVDIAKARVDARRVVERMATDKSWASHPEYVALKDQIRMQNVRETPQPMEELTQSRLGYILLRDQLTQEQFKSDVYNRGLLDLKAASKTLHYVDRQGTLNSTLKSLQEVVKGVYELHGGGKRIGIQPFSDADYQAAKPHFERAWEMYKKAGKSFQQFAEDMITKIGENVTPYLKQMESEHQAPIKMPTPFGDVAAPKGSRVVESAVPRTMGLSVDPTEAAKLLVARRNRRAELRIEKGQITEGETPEIAKLQKTWYQMHPAHKAAMVDQITEMLQGRAKMNGEVNATLKAMTRNKVDAKYLDGTAKPDDVVLSYKGAIQFTTEDMDELMQVADLPDISHSKTRYLLTPFKYVFRRAGAAAERVFLKPHEEAEHKRNLYREKRHSEEKSALAQAKDMGLPKNWNERVADYGISARNEIGARTLRAMGIKPPKWEDLTAGEKHMYEFYRKQFDQLHEHSNMAFKASGREPLEYDGDYVPFMRRLVEYEMTRGNPLTKNMLREEQARYFKANGTPFPFREQLSDNTYKLLRDMRYMYNAYMNVASEHIFRSPIIARQRRMLQPFIAPDGNTIVDLKKNPNTFYQLERYLETLSGTRDTWITPEVDRALYRLNANLGVAIMSGNLRSTLIQPSAFRTALMETGPGYIARGAKRALNKEAAQQAIRESSALNIRFAETFLEERANTVTEKGRKSARKLGDWGLYGLKAADGYTATAVYLGAKEYGAKKLGLSGKALIEYADDIVVRTQASASKVHRARIQNSTWGKLLTLFNTFNLNDFAYLRYDVLGLGNKSMTTRDKAAQMGKLIGYTALINTLFDAAGMRSPFPSPIRSAYDAYKDEMDDDGDEEAAALASAKAAGLEMLEVFPLVGSIRYGSGIGGPLLSTGVEIGQVLSGDRPLYHGIYIAGKVVGIPFTQQAYKSYKAYKKNARESEAAAKRAAKASSSRIRRERSSRHERRTRR